MFCDEAFEGEETQEEAGSPSSQFTKNGVFKASVAKPFINVTVKEMFNKPCIFKTKPASGSRFAQQVEGDDQLRS